MKTVYLSRNPLDPASYEAHECEDVRAFLYEYYDGKKPETLHIFHGEPSDRTDVTPRCEADIERLGEMPGPFYAIEMPGDPGTAILVGAVILGSVAVGVGLALLTQPPIPTQRAGNFAQSSPNNELSERRNRPRLGQRIEDIFGTVRSTPSLIAAPYKVFKNNIEYEVAYMCVGKGEYDISEVKDGDTLASDIDGMNVEIYGPNKKPFVDSPDTTIGSAINRRVLTVTRSNAVNGQTANAPNDKAVVGNNDIKAVWPNQFQTTNTNVDFTELFSAGESVQASSAVLTTTPTGTTLNFGGTYLISSVSTNTLTLDDPGSVNSAWNDPDFVSDGQTTAGSPTLTNTSSVSIGPFTVGDSDTTRIDVNLVALNGLYKTDGENQTAVDVTIEATVSKTGEFDETFSLSISGSATERSTIGKTFNITPSYSGPYQVTFTRTTDSPKEEGFTVQDEVKIRDLYGVEFVSVSDFGNVTTILAETRATDGALAVKERKLNCLATRKIPRRQSDGTFTSNTATYNARDVLIFTARDDYIGNRNDDEIDMQGIADAISDNISYFGSDDGAHFNYTFDDDNLSFEETWRTIAEAVFLEPYRVGNVLKVNFERTNTSSRLLFNHRNTLPNSQKRTVRFGRALNYDGVVYEYVSPDDDTIAQIQLPSTGTVVNPRRVESVGVRNETQAWWHANRIWNKIRYKNTSVEFEALEQANLLVRLDRILVADNTRPDTSDGEVIAQSGLTLTLSQDHTFLSGVDYSIYLQYDDGTVELIDIWPGAESNEVILQATPSGTIQTSTSKTQLTPYIIVGDTDQRVNAFLVDEIDPAGNEANTVIVRAVNYDSRYYDQDGTAPS